MTYAIESVFDANHTGGTKFYQILQVTLTNDDGSIRSLGIIGHYGPVSKRGSSALSPFRGKSKVYGHTKTVTELANEKEKKGYTERRVTKTYGKWKTQDEFVSAMGRMGIELGADDRRLLSLDYVFSQPKAKKEPEPEQAPVTQARSSIGSLATTPEENPWVGTW